MWSSKKQPTVALSTVEAKYVAVANAMKEAVWLYTLLTDIGFEQMRATTIHTDNQGCIALAHNPTNHSHAKHINICHHFIRKRVANREVNLHYVPTNMMLANILTKQLPQASFKKFREALGIGKH